MIGFTDIDMAATNLALIQLLEFNITVFESC